MSIRDFPSKEARMMVLSEGLRHSNELIREACLAFLEPDVAENQSDLCYLLKLIDARMTFTD